jgi:hypothetical protein
VPYSGHIFALLRNYFDCYIDKKLSKHIYI